MNILYLITCLCLSLLCQNLTSIFPRVTESTTIVLDEPPLSTWKLIMTTIQLLHALTEKLNDVQGCSWIGSLDWKNLTKTYCWKELATKKRNTIMANRSFIPFVRMTCDMLHDLVESCRSCLRVWQFESIESCWDPYQLGAAMAIWFVQRQHGRCRQYTNFCGFWISGIQGLSTFQGMQFCQELRDLFMSWSIL